MTKGEVVRVRAAGSSDDWCLGTVEIVSGNGKSVGLRLDGLVRAHGGVIAGFLPLLVDHEAERVTGLLGEEYEIEVQAI